MTSLALPRSFSMSYLRAAEGCLRRAHLEREADVTSQAALLGRVVHDALAAIGTRCSMSGAERISVADAQATAKRVMREPEDSGVLPLEVYSEALALVGRWSRTARFRPGERFEVTSRQKLGGRTLSARIDRLYVDGGLAEATDYKTGRASAETELPTQGRIYGWHAFRLEPGIERVLYAEEHLRWGGSSGPWVVTREDAAEVEEWLSAAVSQVEQAVESGVLPVNPGEACSKWGGCPFASDCPAPRWTRPAAELETEADARSQFEALLVSEAQVSARKDAIRAYLDATGERAIQHNGQEIGYSEKAGSRFDKARLFADLNARGIELTDDEYTAETKPSFGRRKAK